MKNSRSGDSASASTNSKPATRRAARQHRAGGAPADVRTLLGEIKIVRRRIATLEGDTQRRSRAR